MFLGDLDTKNYCTSTMAKRRGRPVPDAVLLKPLVFHLEEALQVENFYRPNLLSLLSNYQKPGEVKLSSRDEAVKNLRFFRVWLDLPRSVFFNAVSYLDMALAKLKVQEKYLKCLTLSCLKLAAQDEQCEIDLKKIIKVSNYKFSATDVTRLSNIVKEKIKVPGGTTPVTPANFLKIYIEAIEHFMKQWEYFKTNTEAIRERMFVSLEIVLADNATAFYRSSVLALLVLHTEIDKISRRLPNKCFFVLGEVLQLWSIIKEFQLQCKIKNQELKNSYYRITKRLKDYEIRTTRKTREPLVWYFSSSTRNRKIYIPKLSTIRE